MVLSIRELGPNDWQIVNAAVRICSDVDLWRTLSLALAANLLLPTHALSQFLRSQVYAYARRNLMGSDSGLCPNLRE